MSLIEEYADKERELLEELLEKDNESVKTKKSIVVRLVEITRKLFELESYADLLLLLNNFWQDRTVYFSILDVKKVNGFIEFQSYLIAHNAEDGISDIAEIQFHLDSEYRIDLIMMVLHPNAEF